MSILWSLDTWALGGSQYIVLYILMTPLLTERGQSSHWANVTTWSVLVSRARNAKLHSKSYQLKTCLAMAKDCKLTTRLRGSHTSLSGIRQLGTDQAALISTERQTGSSFTPATFFKLTAFHAGARAELSNMNEMSCWGSSELKTAWCLMCTPNFQKYPINSTGTLYVRTPFTDNLSRPIKNLKDLFWSRIRLKSPFKRKLKMNNADVWS